MPGLRPFALVLMAAALPLAGCGKKESAPTEATQTAPAGGVVRSETPTPEAPVQSMPTQAVIQSQPGPDGSQVDLLKVAVTGDILTVTLRCSGDREYNTESFRIGNISVVEDATSQRLSVLRDNAGVAMVSDYHKAGTPEADTTQTNCGKRPGVIWAKFPAPAASSPTVSINFPGVGPFDGIPVAR